MARLEDFTDGSIVLGVIPHEPVTVVTTKWHGSSCLEVFCDRQKDGLYVGYKNGLEINKEIAKKEKSRYQHA